MFSFIKFIKLQRLAEFQPFPSILIASGLFLLLLQPPFGMAQRDGDKDEAQGKLVFSIRKPLTSLEAFKASIGMGKQVGAPWWRLYTSNLCTINPDGTAFKQLTDDGVSRGPEWSPNGKLIAYISGVGENESLNVMRQDGSEKRALLERQVKIDNFWWSPDSSALLVSVNTKKLTDPMESWVVTVDGESKKRMAYSKWASGWNHWDAVKAEVTNPSDRLLSSLPKGTEWPEWTPDRKHIAFIANSAGQRILAVANVEDVISMRQWFPQLSEPPCDEIFEWTKDGKKLLFLAASRVCSAEIQKGRLENFINISGSYGDEATWNRDGSQVAFVKAEPGRGNTEIYIVDADGSNPVRITNTNYNHGELDWR
jgi:Tol biopolymer transport system component